MLACVKMLGCIAFASSSGWTEVASPDALHHNKYQVVRSVI